MCLEDVGRIAAEHLLSAINGEPTHGVHAVPCRLVARQSTDPEPGSGPPPASAATGPQTAPGRPVPRCPVCPRPEAPPPRANVRTLFGQIYAQLTTPGHPLAWAGRLATDGSVTARS